MEKITIQLKKPYDVYIGQGILAQSGKLISQVKKPANALIISDSNVFPLYGATVKHSLEQAGFKIKEYVFPAGEKSKNMATIVDILEFMASQKISRSDLVIALGGGVCGDMAGFAAAIYQRGLPFVQIPTTLLAAVDSSVGGKTGVDLAAGKNLVGAFHQPALVICDIACFDTLSNDIYLDGLGEVVKYGCILDAALFARLAQPDFRQDIAAIVATCIKLKAAIVIEDEFDTGRRQILNFGHSLGHAIEVLSNFEISHGKAVAIGMYLIEKSAQSPFAASIKELLNSLGLATDCPFTAAEIAAKAGHDKKILNGKLNLILLEEIGHAYLKPIDLSELAAFIKRGLDDAH